MGQTESRSMGGYWLTVALLALLPLPFVGLADQVVGLDPERPVQVFMAFAAGNLAAFVTERMAGDLATVRLRVGAFLVVAMAALAMALAAMPFVNAALAQAGLLNVAGSRWVGLGLRLWETQVGCLMVAGFLASFGPPKRRRSRREPARQGRFVPEIARRSVA